MALKQNIIYIYFKGKHSVTSKSQYQYNHGQFLYFADLDLPQAFEVHFSNKDKGYSKPQVGSNKLVEIPDEYFWSGASQIYAWVYLHSNTDDGETIYEVKIPLTKRAKPTDEEPLPQQESAMERAIAELNNAVEITTENANKTEEDKTQVGNIRDEVVDLKENIDATAETVAQKSQEAIDASRRSEASAQNAAEFEDGARRYSEDASQSAQEALESKNIAKQKAQVANDASAEAKDFRDEAETFKNEAEQAKQNIVDYMDETKGYRDETLTAKDDAQTIKGDIQSLKTQIDDAADNVFENAREAYHSMISADNASLSASESAENASQSANEANQSATNASESASQAEEFKNQTEKYKTQAETFKNQAEEFKNQTETNVTHYPKIIGEYWYVWDATNGEYVNTNVDANGIKGDTGRGIASVALNDDYTLTITFTDDTTYTTSSIRGQQGEKGDTGKTGESGVYIGTEEPENKDIKVWIDTDDDGTSEDLIKNIESLKENIYKPYAVDSASGSIASFADGADDIPLKSLMVMFEPQQDLNGYDSPWVGGGGKNLLNAVSENIYKYSSYTNYTFDEQNKSVTINGNTLMGFSVPVEPNTTYTYYGRKSGGTALIYMRLREYSSNNASFSSDGYIGQPISSAIESDANGWFKKSFTTTADTHSVLCALYRSGATDPAVVINDFMLSKDDSLMEYNPYENICPINGWTGMNVRRCNENLWDDAWYSLGNVMQKITDETSPFYGFYNGAVARWEEAQRSENYRLFPNGVDSLTVSGDIGSKGTSGFTFRVYFAYTDGTYVSSGNIPVSSGATLHFTKTSATGKKCTGFVIGTSAGATNVNGVIKNVMVSVDGVTELVEPVQNPLIPINWQTEAGTVYGGKLDVLSGVMTVDMVMVDLGTQNWGLASNQFYANLVGAKLGEYSIKSQALCSVYPILSWAAFLTSGTDKAFAINTGQPRINVKDSTYTDATSFKTAMSGVQLVYELAEPITIQLTPHEVNSLLGVNNIWADSGDTHVEYRADTKLYINKKITEALASLT